MASSWENPVFSERGATWSSNRRYDEVVLSCDCVRTQRENAVRDLLLANIRGRPHVKEVDVPGLFRFYTPVGKPVSVRVGFAVVFDESSQARFCYVIAKRIFDDETHALTESFEENKFDSDDVFGLLYPSGDNLFGEWSFE